MATNNEVILKIVESFLRISFWPNEKPKNATKY